MRLYRLYCYDGDMNEAKKGKQDHYIDVGQSCIYQIKIQGRLSKGMLRQFDDMTITMESDRASNPITTLTGQVADQSALHGLVARIRDYGLPLLLVQLVSPITHEG